MGFLYIIIFPFIGMFGTNELGPRTHIPLLKGRPIQGFRLKITPAAPANQNVTNNSPHEKLKERPPCLAHNIATIVITVLQYFNIAIGSETSCLARNTIVFILTSD